MQTDIGYLRELEEDILEAAWRESLPSERRRRARRPRSRAKLVAVLAAASLVAAGGTGYVALFGTGPIAQRDEALPQGVEQGLPMATPAPAEAGFARSLEESLRGTSDAAAGQVATTVGPGDLARIVKTAEISVVVDEGTFGDSFEAASEIAGRYGGFVQATSTRGGRSGRLVMRVPAARFDDALRDLRDLGRVEAQSITGEDVTAQFVDLRGRLEISGARREVLLGLMAKATTIESTLRVQNALDDVQLRIEEIKGQLHLLQNQTDKATIRVSMRETGVPLEAQNVENPSIRNAWDRAIAGFFGVIFAVVVGLGYLVPATILAAIGWFVYRRIRPRAA
ncbi:MAG: DUF4349 domain-containing protein [Actinobacteria bacterium]|nr:DUF4349 domain-containing protein [Actinomycetota bacterium]